MLLDEGLKSLFENVLESSILSYSSLSGGDTASVFRIDTSKRLSYILKCSRLNVSQNMFEAEANGLKLIAKTNTIATPKVINSGIHNGSAYLLMEYIPSKSPSSKDYSKLGFQLSQLHNHTSENFGLNSDNYIGSLEQRNTRTENWINFYSEQRLGFQLKLALKKGVLNSSEIPSSQNIKLTFEGICNGIKPSLLHGDLWGGNFIIAEDGTPYLIDPATYYGHSEIDIAMSKLFGGFNLSFYEAYHSNRPITNFYNQRIELYQLYYLLVHLNIFGSTYYGSVKRILKSYF
ncbi:fructosamine kinase family protein [Winogradskyella sp.]|uniref:fructosamine kinase family protein n=1 Tax=Winogradskyella sp. TaxID=1883156 RepID=UPI0026135C08|nr:fructosamine kinase family protein [Winogradskyella sp.]